MDGNGNNPQLDFLKPQERVANPSDRLPITQQLSENVILTTVDDLYNWVRLSSLWPMMYGTACCFIEFAALIGSRFDFDRFGLLPRTSPRQADLIILAGTLNMKMSAATRRLYEQMPEPKYVIAMGACMITGGMFSADSPTAVRGADKILPIDVYIPGCPPRPEAIIDAIIKLRKKIARESLQERDTVQQQGTRRYSVRHNLQVIPRTHDGNYVRAAFRQKPPLELAQERGIPLPELLRQMEPDMTAEPW